MPLFREWSIEPYSLAAIWKIEEPATFFMEKTGLVSEIKNEKRSLEFLTGRFLLKYLKHDFPLLHIAPDAHDKPRLANNEYYFSISHSYPYVAVVVSPYVECGIDIQVWHHNMERLQHKFLSETEQHYFHNDPQLLTLAWCAKEAAYKWQGRRGVDFIEHLPIQKFEHSESDYFFSILLKFKEQNTVIFPKGFIEKDFACCVVEIN